MKIRLLLFVLAAFLFTQLNARPFRVGQIPNGSVNGCANCHMSAGGGDERNAFGRMVETRFLTAAGAAGQVEWGPLLASLDADGDGVSNGAELLDPFGTWQSGQPDPGNSTEVTHPGNLTDNNLLTASVQFTNMSPHSGQLLQLRVIDKSTFKEVYRTSIESISSADFNIELENIEAGHSYFVDFFVDFNNNNRYDSPPADHTWRLNLDNARGGDVLQFGHNTDFTELNWRYLLTISFTGMSPHAGQLLELRVENDTDNFEAGRTRIESISQPEFDIEIAGLETGKEYKVEFYADFNNNGTYDSPPTDHAWEIRLDNINGDTTITFAHNTNFTEINWKYLFALNFENMTPHLGQLIELRVVKENDNTEVGRVSLDSIVVNNFTLTIPGLESSTGYRADFYADFNNNGQYDAPPTDHAWRINFTTEEGNAVQNFSHNTNFTDIQWPLPTDVTDNETLPDQYTLAQNYPNPFNPVTRINYQLPESGTVTIKIFNSLGQEITTLLNDYKDAGTYNIDFNASGFESGVYYYRLTAGSITISKKMLLLK